MVCAASPLRGKIKDWLDRNMDNVPDQSVMSTRKTVVSVSKPFSAYVQYKARTISISLNVTCSCHDLAGNLLKANHSYSYHRSFNDMVIYIFIFMCPFGILSTHYIFISTMLDLVVTCRNVHMDFQRYMSWSFFYSIENKTLPNVNEMLLNLTLYIQIITWHLSYLTLYQPYVMISARELIGSRDGI